MHRFDIVSTLDIPISCDHCAAQLGACMNVAIAQDRQIEVKHLQSLASV
jgi:hypothetical protein